MNLRDALLASLASLPGTREFHLHVLVSSPRKHLGLFPFAQPRPRTYLQDILILLSEQATPVSSRILTTAIEACLYHVPSTSVAVLYVSKVDSTGQSTPPSPASTLVRSLLLFYANPATRPLAVDHLWIQLFARAQAQYLFPNSSEYSGKRPLTDVQLCSWWKRVLSDVAGELDLQTKSEAKIKLYYILPGYSELEAINSLKFTASSATSTSATYPWTYGHPYSQTEIPLPCPSEDVTGRSKNLGHFIPSFDDDPKSRFIDEIAYTTDADGIKSPSRKRRREMSVNDRSEPERAQVTEAKDRKDERPLGELGKVSPDEFWERMSYRQECIAGAVTGFFALGMSYPAPKDANSHPTVSPLAPQPGQVSSQINKRIITSLLTGVEFSNVERAIRATEAIEGAIKGLCEGLATVPAAVIHAPRTIPLSSQSDRRTPEPQSSHLEVPCTPPPRGKRAIAEVSPNPFPEPVMSLETYYSHIYGSVCVNNPAPPPKMSVGNETGQPGAKQVESTPQVTVLAVRKKKKRN